MEPSTTTGRSGSLSNPEVYDNVPGHVIPIIAEEFADFDNEAAKFLDGQTEENIFIGFRLKQGVYGQRQPDVQMIRVKLPWGGVTPDQGFGAKVVDWFVGSDHKGAEVGIGQDLQDGLASGVGEMVGEKAAIADDNAQGNWFHLV